MKSLIKEQGVCHGRHSSSPICSCRMFLVESISALFLTFLLQHFSNPLNEQYLTR
jgi:hypothetical protein